jgi:hypothetical protein
MIPNIDERTERQLYAAYRLILSWPKREVRDEESRSAAIPAEDADRAVDVATARDDGNVAGECNKNE